MDQQVFVGLLFLTAGGLAVTFFLGWRIRTFQARAARAEGTVTRFTQEQTTTWKGQGEGSETTTWHYPHVEFLKRTVRVGKKAFLFLGAADMMVKLRESLAAAVRLASKEPERYEVGANGWVTAQLGDAPPLDLLEKWVDESYRVVVNKGVDLAQDRRPPRAKRKPTVGK